MKTILKKIISRRTINTFWHKPRAILAATRYGFPAHKITCVAIAGTKGKTSTAYFLHHLLQTSGMKSALFSTATTKIGATERLNVWKMTTPSPFALQNFLKQAVDQKCSHAVIEVSSHALEQHRVWSIPFQVGVITNLTPDHLEYHESAEEYILTHKKLLLSSLRVVLLNCDDVHSVFLKNDPRARCISEDTALWNDLTSSEKAWWAPFQKTNILAASAAAHALGLSKEHIATALQTLPTPPGRFEEVQGNKPFRIIVDYAHSPESLSYFFKNVRPLVSGALIVVYGACGDRDAKQRPLMGTILESYADTIILTSDDPYSEDPAAIAKHVQLGIPEKTSKSILTILDRKSAIKKALEIARPGDCVCVLGKGAEQWQIFKQTKIPWDDRRIIRDLLA